MNAPLLVDCPLAARPLADLPLVKPPLSMTHEPPNPWIEATVDEALPEHRFGLTDGRIAAQAASCLLCPLPGDRVLVFDGREGRYITAVLLRATAPVQPVCTGRDETAAAPATARLSVPGAERLLIQQPQIDIQAQTSLRLQSRGDAALTSAHGTVSISAQHLLSTVSGSLVQTARHWVTQVEHGLLQAKALLRMHGGQTLITAKDDMKLDAERISMG